MGDGLAPELPGWRQARLLRAAGEAALLEHGDRFWTAEFVALPTSLTELLRDEAAGKGLECAP